MAMVGWGNGVRYGRGTNAARLFEGQPQMWCCLLARTVLQRTQHFGLQLPIWAWLHRVAMSRPPVFCFNQAKSRGGTTSILETGWSESSPACPPSCCWWAPSGGAALNELRSLILVSPAQRRFHTHVSYCQRFNRCQGTADSEIGKSG
jgi:hypothetical protein